MIRIPFENYPSFRQEVLLDNTSYILDFNWNSRGQFWSMGIYNVFKEPVVLGIKLVLNYELINQFSAYDIPQGEMYVIDPSGDRGEIEQYDLVNGRCSLIYLSEDEI